MSIINEALKKVMSEKVNNINVLQSPRKELLNSFYDISSRNKSLNVPSYKPKKRIFDFKIALITLLAIGGIIISLLFNVINHTKSNLKEKVLSANLKGISFNNAYTSGTSSSFNNTEQFKLSGIFLDKNNESLAIINNEIVKENGYISGAFVKNIRQDNVTLLLDNKEIVLVNK